MSLLGVSGEPVEVIATATLEPGTVAVWLIRILFPCLLFWLSFGNCSCAWAPWHSRTRHLRETLLQHRAAVLVAESKKRAKPAEMESLRLVDKTSAPALFQDQKKEARGDSGQRADGLKESRGDRDRERRESKRERRKDKTDPKEKTEKPRVPWEIVPEEGASSSTARAPLSSDAPAMEAMEDPTAKEDGQKQMLLASLVNFVAFNRRDQVPFFLPQEDCIPPPPPWPRPGSTPAKPATGAASERANLEGQMVLRGMLASSVCGSSVARCLFAQLTDASIEVSADTFELLVEVCIKADDMETAGDLLMKMDEAGKAPGNPVLDKVMEMYLAHVARNQSAEEKTEKQLQNAGLELSSASTTVVPPPPPPLPPTLIPTSSAQGQQTTGPPPAWEPAALPEPLPPLVNVSAPQTVNGIGGYATHFQHYHDAADRPNASSIAHDMMELAREERRKKLPAFSIPDEFAAESAAGGNARSSADIEQLPKPAAQQEVGSSLSAAAAEFVPVSRETAALPGISAGGLSAAAAEFVPVALEQPAMSPQGNAGLSAHAAEFVPVAMDPTAATAAGQYMQADATYDAPYGAAYDVPYDAAYEMTTPGYEEHFDAALPLGATYEGDQLEIF